MPAVPQSPVTLVLGRTSSPATAPDVPTIGAVPTAEAVPTTLVDAGGRLGGGVAANAVADAASNVAAASGPRIHFTLQDHLRKLHFAPGVSNSSWITMDFVIRRKIS